MGSSEERVYLGGLLNNCEKDTVISATTTY